MTDQLNLQEFKRLCEQTDCDEGMYGRYILDNYPTLIQFYIPGKNKWSDVFFAALTLKEGTVEDTIVDPTRFREFKIIEAIKEKLGQTIWDKDVIALVNLMGSPEIVAYYNTKFNRPFQLTTSRPSVFRSRFF